MIAWEVADGLTAAASVPASGCRIGSGASIQPACLASAGSREPVVRIRPGSCLLRILPCRADAIRQLRQLVSTSLADSRERHRVSGQI
ncbi:MAG TPA: hypothetical protein VGH96_03765 [Streptosporangiaceae bacterium]